MDIRMQEQPMLNKRKQVKVKKGLARFLTESLLILFSAFIFLPFSWMISTSLRLPKDSFSLPPAFFPNAFNVSNYVEVFVNVPFLAFFWNSLKISTLTVLGAVVISSLAAYAFARLQFPGRNLLFVMIVAGLMIPHQVTIIPKFILMSYLGWMDTHSALIVPALINPMGIFLIRQMMITIPRSYEEAAFIDGAGQLKVFWKIIVPMSMPAIIVTGVLTFIHSWNDFFTPLVFLTSNEKMTLPLGMTVLKGAFESGNLSAILAGVTLSLVAPLLFYIFGQRYLVEGIMVGGIKS